MLSRRYIARIVSISSSPTYVLGQLDDRRSIHWHRDSAWPCFSLQHQRHWLWSINRRRHRRLPRRRSLNGPDLQWLLNTLH